MSRVTALRARLLVAAYAAILLVAISPGMAWPQSKPAIVEGTSQLFIRRGPGTEFPPFATLTGGSQVQVEELRDQWARVTTASGQVGYVHVKFLRMIEDQPPTNTEPPTMPPTVARPATREPTSNLPQATRTPAGRHREARPDEPATPTEEAAEVSTAPSLQSTPTAIEASMPASRPHAGGGTEAELRRLADVVEALNRRFDQRLPIPEGAGATDEPTAAVSGGAVLLGLVGGIIGWLLGATYQRNKERGRRSRIRL